MSNRVVMIAIWKLFYFGSFDILVLFQSEISIY